MTREEGEAIIRSSYPIPGRQDDGTLTISVLVALEKHGLLILSDEGVLLMAADIRHTQLQRLALYREEEERRAKHSAEEVAFPGANL